MRQTLLWIPRDIAGIPVFGIGLLLGVWVLVSLVVLIYLVRKQGFNADTRGYVPIFAIVAVVIAFVLPVLLKEDGLPIRGYGVMLLLAVLAATGLAAWRAKRLGLDPEMILTLAFWVFIPGIIGARLFYVIEYWPTNYWPVFKDPNGGLLRLLGEIINVTEGGLVVYGAFIGGVLGVILFVRKYRLPLAALCDLVAPSLVLGLAIGRLGCFLNGCCYGGACDKPWAVTFPQGSPPYHGQITRGELLGFRIPDQPGAVPVVQSVVPNSPAEKAGLQAGDRLIGVNGNTTLTSSDVYHWIFESEEPTQLALGDGRSITFSFPPRSHPIHPTQIYSCINALLICLLLLAYDPFHRRDGELTALLLTLYATSRFLLEIIRTDEVDFLHTGLTISQNVSLMVLLAGIAVWFYTLRQPPGKAFEKGA